MTQSPCPSLQLWSTNIACICTTRKSCDLVKCVDLVLTVPLTRPSVNNLQQHISSLRKEGKDNWCYIWTTVLSHFVLFCFPVCTEIFTVFPALSGQIYHCCQVLSQVLTYLFSHYLSLFLQCQTATLALFTSNSLLSVELCFYHWGSFRLWSHKNFSLKETSSQAQHQMPSMHWRE